MTPWILLLIVSIMLVLLVRVVCKYLWEENRRDIEQREAITKLLSENLMLKIQNRLLVSELNTPKEITNERW